MIIGLILIIAGGILLLYNRNQNNHFKENNENVLIEIETSIEMDSIERNSNTAVKELDVNGNKYIGILYIPTLDNLSLPVLKDCTDENLKISICKYNGAPEDNNLIIGGHRYRSSFGKLSNLNIGNLAYYTDLCGNTYKYSLVSIEILDPSQGNELEDGDWDMTLFTCNYTNTKREVYRFER